MQNNNNIKRKSIAYYTETESMLFFKFVSIQTRQVFRMLFIYKIVLASSSAAHQRHSHTFYLFLLLGINSVVFLLLLFYNLMQSKQKPLYNAFKKYKPKKHHKYLRNSDYCNQYISVRVFCKLKPSNLDSSACSYLTRTDTPF